MVNFQLYKGVNMKETFFSDQVNVFKIKHDLKFFTSILSLIQGFFSKKLVSIKIEFCI